MGRRNHGKRNTENWQRVSHRKRLELLRLRDIQTLVEKVDELLKNHNQLVVEVRATQAFTVEQLTKLIGERAREGVLILPSGIPGQSTAEQLKKRLDEARVTLAKELLAREQSAEVEPTEADDDEADQAAADEPTQAGSAA